MIFSKIPIGDYVEIAVYWIELNLGWLLDIISDFLGFMITGFRDFLMLFPPLIFALLIAALAYFTGKKNLKLAVGTFVGLLLIEICDYGHFQWKHFPCDLLGISGTGYEFPRNSRC